MGRSSKVHQLDGWVRTVHLLMKTTAALALLALLGVIAAHAPDTGSAGVTAATASPAEEQPYYFPAQFEGRFNNAFEPEEQAPTF